MPTYKLHYFNIRGRAEPIRLMLAAAGVKYEDIRIEFPDWPNKKKTFTFGQVPVLEIDGYPLNQSVAIMHYLATQHGLAGKSPLDAARCLALVEQINDLMNPITDKLFKEKDADRKRNMLNNEVAPLLKEKLAVFEALLKKGPICPNQLTYADIYLYNAVFNTIEWLGKDFCKPFPYLLKNHDSVHSHPKIKDYVSKRPYMPM